MHSVYFIVLGKQTCVRARTTECEECEHDRLLSQRLFKELPLERLNCVYISDSSGCTERYLIRINSLLDFFATMILRATIPSFPIDSMGESTKETATRMQANSTVSETTFIIVPLIELILDSEDR